MKGPTSPDPLPLDLGIEREGAGLIVDLNPSSMAYDKASPANPNRSLQIAAGSGGDQGQRAVEVALAAAIGAAHQRQRPQRQREAPQRAIARHSQMAQTAGFGASAAGHGDGWAR